MVYIQPKPTVSVRCLILKKGNRAYIQPETTVGGSVLVIVERHPFLPKKAAAIEADGASPLLGHHSFWCGAQLEKNDVTRVMCF